MPGLAAYVVQRWVLRRYGARVLLLVIPHTFGKDLKFNSHVHLLVSQGGLRDDEAAWLPDLPLNMTAIMRMWRYSVVTLLRMAHRFGVLSTDMDETAFARLLDECYRKWWHVYCRRFASKGQVLR